MLTASTFLRPEHDHNQNMATRQRRCRPNSRGAQALRQAQVASHAPSRAKRAVISRSIHAPSVGMMNAILASVRQIESKSGASVKVKNGQVAITGLPEKVDVAKSMVEHITANTATEKATAGPANGGNSTGHAPASPFYCTTCDVDLNSQINFAVHTKGKRHHLAFQEKQEAAQREAQGQLLPLPICCHHVCFTIVFAQHLLVPSPQGLRELPSLVFPTRSCTPPRRPRSLSVLSILSVLRNQHVPNPLTTTMVSARSASANSRTCGSIAQECTGSAVIVCSRGGAKRS